jgi:hypothetical protein
VLPCCNNHKGGPTNNLSFHVVKRGVDEGAHLPQLNLLKARTLCSKILWTRSPITLSGFGKTDLTVTNSDSQISS